MKALAQPILAAILVLFFPFVCFGQPERTPDSLAAPWQDHGSRLRVAAYVSPPLVMESTDGTLSGLAVQAFKQSAQSAGLTYDMQPASMSEILDGLASGRFDVGIGAITVTPQREEIVDFSHPINSSGTGFAVSKRFDASTTLGQLRKILANLAKLSIALFGLMLLFALIVWRLEVTLDESHFESGWRGLGKGLWWAAVTMSTVGYGDTYPKSFLGRIVCVFWIFLGIVAFSIFTASTTSILTNAQAESAIRGLANLRELRIAVAAASSGQEFAAREALQYTTYATIEEAAQAVIEGDADAIVSNILTLRYALANRPRLAKHFTLGDQPLAENYMAMAFAPDSPHREALNRALVSLTTHKDWKGLVNHYLGMESRL